MKPQVIMLAAGQSNRFGSHKLMHPMPDGRPMILHSLQAYLDNDLPVCVICRSDDELPALLSQNNIQYLIAPDAYKGMGHSLAYGVEYCFSNNGWLIALADMPYLQASSIKQLLLNGQDKNKEGIARLEFEGRAGHPVFFPPHFSSKLQRLKGDKGAREIIKNETVMYVAVDDRGCLDDIDTPQDLPD